MSKGISRRSFLTGAGSLGATLGGIAAVGGASAVAMTTLSGCSLEKAEALVSDASASTCVRYGADTTYGALVNPQESFESDSTDFSAIFQPLTLSGHTMKNRLGKSCAGSEMQHSTTEISDTSLAYYERFCQGGIGMICVEASKIIPAENKAAAEFGALEVDLTTDEGIEAHRVMSEMAHKYGTLVIAQMLDMGMATGGSCSSPKGAKLEIAFGGPAAQTTEDLHREQQYFIDAAERYYKAGFDGVEINASCNHYFSTYLSRYQNTERTDEYSGESIENRARVVTEIIEGIRERVGRDFVIQVLYSAVEGNVEELGKDELCTSIDEGVEFAKLFEKAGASCLHIRSQLYGLHPGGFMPDVMHYCEHGDTGYASVVNYNRHFGGIIEGRFEGYGGLLDVAARIKAAVSIPVGTVGAMDPRVAPELFDNAIRDGKVDFYLMTRPLMADFHYANKLSEGRVEEIAPCVRCMTCFVAQVDMGTPMYCRVNPALTRAYTEDMPEGYDPQPTSSAKKVMVIGGGPAGMEVARVAAERGHTVTLYERAGDLAGFMNLAMVIKGPHERLIDHKKYLIRQLELLNVTVITGKEIDADAIERENPDAVVVAVGGAPEESLAPDAENVSSLYDYFDYGLNGEDLPLGDSVVVYGGRLQAGNLVMNLVKAGKNVTMLNPGPESELLMGAASWPRRLGQEWLHAKGVTMYHNVEIISLVGSTVTFATESGANVTAYFDNFVDARPLVANRSLYNEIKKSYNEVYAVGDCYSPSTIANATARANLVARKLGEGSTLGDAALGENQYAGTAVGIGDVTVVITVESDMIVAVEVDTSEETQGIGRELGENFADEILATGVVDAVSGATITSDAVRQALEEAKGAAGVS